MSELTNVRDTLLTISHPDRLLRYADDLMEMRRKQGDQFTLTAKDVWLLPILEFYTEDLEGWMNFLKNVRDRLPESSAEREAVQDFYKVVNVRFIQRRTRSILDVAVDVATKKQMIENNWNAKQLYAKRCIQSWKARKDNMLTNVRKSSPTGRVSLDHREELLRDFWEMVSEEVNNGEVPKA
jgi:hypothetical protein